MAAVAAVAGEFVHRPVHLSALISLLKAAPPPTTTTTTKSSNTIPLPITLQSIHPLIPQPTKTFFDAAGLKIGAHCHHRLLFPSLLIPFNSFKPNRPFVISLYAFTPCWDEVFGEKAAPNKKEYTDKTLSLIPSFVSLSAFHFPDNPHLTLSDEVQPRDRK